jgi:hypothetical protein
MQNDNYEKQVDLAVIAESRKEGTMAHADIVDYERRNRIWADLDSDTSAW